MVRLREWVVLGAVVVALLALLASGAEAQEIPEGYCWVTDRTVYEDEVYGATVDALGRLEFALMLLDREPGEPPRRGDPEVALKQATELARQAWQLLKAERR